MPALKPCAHCDGEAEMDTMQAYRKITNGDLGRAVAIYCTQCTIQVTICHADHSGLEIDELIHMAAETWNRRPACQHDYIALDDKGWECKRCGHQT